MLWLRKNQQLVGEPAFPWLVMLPYTFINECVLPEDPDVTWSARMLLKRKVDTGGSIPVLFFYDRLMRMSPRLMVE